MEDAFSSTLGEAARKTQLILVIALFAVVSTFLIAAILFSRRLVGQSEAIESALRQGEHQLRGLLQFAPLPIIIVRLSDEAVLFANEHALREFKMPAVRASGKASDFYVNPDDRRRLVAHLTEHHGANDWEVRLKDGEGQPFWASLSSQCISYHGEQCVLSAVSNIDVRKRNQQELHRRAYHDELTGLPNRAMFMASLDETFESKARDGGKFALMFLDLDRFKVINDELGHGAGDKLLQEVAIRLKSSVFASDVVARLGGDEFVVLVTKKADQEMLHLTAQNIMAAMLVPIQIDGTSVQITCSIGISRYPQDGADLMSMMKSADRAMYRAKERGRNNFQWYGAEEQGGRAGPEPPAPHRPRLREDDVV
jgi:diguanylate cyclase (GGDEF)-like protein